MLNIETKVKEKKQFLQKIRAQYLWLLRNFNHDFKDFIDNEDDHDANVGDGDDDMRVLMGLTVNADYAPKISS